MASADGCVHIINISSDKTSNNAPILKYCKFISHVTVM